VSAGYDALRTSAAVTDGDHVHALRVSGPGAFDLLDRALGRDLYVQSGRILQTLALRPDGTTLADVEVASDDDAFLLLAEGPREELLAHLAAARLPGAAATIEDLRDRAAVLVVTGPYAWELLGAVIGPEIVGLPYLTFLHADGLVCLRSGKTGEYGYHLLVPREALPALRARLADAGRAFALAEATLEDLDQAALENWFFDVRREGAAGLTPLELQLQWRVSRRKAFVGSDALARRRAEGIRRRVTTALSPGAVAAGDRVLDGGREAGTIVNAGRCTPRGEWVALCLLDVAVAWPGLSLATPAGAPLATVAPPVLRNRSLFVSPQRHAFATRERDEFPPLC
jgi:aminomethyltransferase